ncbi:MAG: GNAT family N-acetyltransferase [Oscillospiraceae bacterium]
MIEITRADSADLEGLLELYVHLNDNSLPKIDERIENIWSEILEDKNRHTLVARDKKRVVASLSLFINQSLVRNQRPFALVEYVVTHPEYRGKGIAGKLLEIAQQKSQEQNCYKIMLITGQSSEKVHRLYQNSGYKSQGKTAYVKELEERLI